VVIDIADSDGTGRRPPGEMDYESFLATGDNPLDCPARRKLPRLLASRPRQDCDQLWLSPSSNVYTFVKRRGHARTGVVARVVLQHDPTLRYEQAP